MNVYLYAENKNVWKSINNCGSYLLIITANMSVGMLSSFHGCRWIFKMFVFSIQLAIYVTFSLSSIFVASYKGMVTIPGNSGSVANLCPVHLPGQNIFCPGQNTFCTGQNNFCPRQNIFVPDKTFLSWTKKFVLS